MRLLYACLCAGTILILGVCFYGCSPVITLEAQSLPASVHVAWNPNATSDNVIGYVVLLDGANPQVVGLSACSATTCVAAVSVGAVGAHAITVAAQNLALSADPNSVQTGPASNPVNFTLNLVPAKVSGATVGK